jgi:hypothetical protein
MPKHCQICDRSFSGQQALQQDLNSPAQALVYECEDCDWYSNSVIKPGQVRGSRGGASTDARVGREGAGPEVPGYARQHEQPCVIAVQEQGNAIEDPLPERWEAQKTEGGQVYFVDHNTKSTTWTRPDLLEAVGTLPEGWEAQRTQKGRVYFVDHNTKSTTWIRPHFLEALRKPPEGWEEQQTEEGRVYYVDHNTKSTSWIHPLLAPRDLDFSLHSFNDRSTSVQAPIVIHNFRIRKSQKMSKGERIPLARFSGSQSWLNTKPSREALDRASRSSKPYDLVVFHPASFLVLHNRLSKVSDTRLTEFVHSPLDLEGHAIRLLDLHPLSDASSDIRCTIQQVKLEDKPNYKALSYAWGNPNVTFPILVDEKRYHVTANCHAALYRLREMGEISMWIDAICINQKDNAEKSTQIPLMKDIYSSAGEVIVWLGCSEAERRPYDEANEALALALIEDLTAEDIGGFDNFIQLAMRGRVPKLRWKYLVDIMNHVWFERLWVHQEIIVSLKATALFQYHSIPFAKIQLVSEKSLLFSETARQEHLPFLVNEPKFFKGCLKVWSRAEAQLNYDINRRIVTGMSLFEILRTTRHYNCFNPRDRVYAVLGLVENKSAHKIRLDYTQSVAELYTAVAWEIIQESQTLEVIHLAGLDHLNLADSTRLPSWVMDWRTDIEKLPGNIVYNSYQAALDSNPLVSFCSTTRTLEVGGISIDSIWTSVNIDVKDAGMASGAAGLFLWKERFSMYPSRCEPRQAYIRTICADMHPNKHLTRLSQDILDFYEVLFQAKEISQTELDAKTEHVFPRGNMEYDKYQESLLQEVWQCGVNIGRAVSSRRFFISEVGYMGLGPLALQQGDMVCVLLGCNVPLLIRKEEDYHLLVGECFVWGLMDGEAVKDRKDDGEYEVFQLR